MCIPADSFPEPMSRQIKGIAPSLGPPIEELALPLNAPEGAQVAARTRDQVVVENSESHLSA